MPFNLLLAVTFWSTLAPSAAHAQNQDYFEPQCQSENDYGWPRFQSLKELEASPWSSYFQSVYGELPSKYPVCVYDLWSIDSVAYAKANITGHKLVPQADVKEGDLFVGMGEGVYGIYHETWKPLPDNAWVEITHTAVPSEVQGFWAWRTKGSGVWYNIGKTIVFPTPKDMAQVHKEAIEFLMTNCSKKPSALWPQLESDIFGFCAREKGFDSIQFEPTQGVKPTSSFGMTGLTEMVLVNIDGKHNCGVEDASKTPLHEGWMASRQCECTNYEFADSCGLMPKAPFPYSLIGASPCLCKNQEGPPFWNRWKSCDPTTCKPTKCGSRKTPIADNPVLETQQVETFTV